MRVDDGSGDVGEASAILTVGNSAPTAALANDGPVNEGSTAVVSFSNQLDPSSADTAAGFTYLYDFDNDGTFDLTSSDPSATVPAIHLDDNADSPLTVHARIQDADGGGSDYTTQIVINSVAPTATLTNNGPVDEASPTTVTIGGPFDPSTADTTAGFTYHYDFDNDGTFEISETTSSSVTVPASFLDGGLRSRTVRARISDKDGDFNDYTTVIAINVEALPMGTLVTPVAGSVTNLDLGYVAIQWDAAALAELDETTFDTTDVTISDVSVDRIENRGGGLVRYWYNADGDKLVGGSVIVSSSTGAVLDLDAAPSAPFSSAFTFDAPSEPEDVTDRVEFNFYGRQYNRRTGIWGFYASVTNTSTVEFAYPIRLLITELGSTGTTVENSDGTLDDGTPYFDFAGAGTLGPGQTTTAVVIAIHTPPRVTYSFVPLVFAIVTSASDATALSSMSDALVVIQRPAFQNSSDRYDVNSDGSVSAQDAFSVINHLDRGTELIAEDIAEVTGLEASKWVDVNGDGKASALDALSVINELGRQRIAGTTSIAQGEQIRKDEESEHVVDEVYTNLTEDDVDSLFAACVGQEPRQIKTEIEPNASRDESEQDMNERLESLEYVLQSEMTWFD